MISLGQIATPSDILEDLQAPIIAINYVDTVIPVTKKSRRETEAPNLLAGQAEEKEQPPRHIKDLNVVKCRIGNVNMPEGIDRHAARTGETPRPIAEPADDPEALPFRSEDLDPEMQGIGDVKASSGIDKEVGWSAEKTIATGTTAAALNVGTVGIEDLHQPLGHIGHVEPPCVIDGKPPGTAEATGRQPKPTEFAFAVEDKDLVQDRIGDKESVPTGIVGHPDRRGKGLATGGGKVVHATTGEVKNVNNQASGIGNPDPPPTVGRHPVGCQHRHPLGGLTAKPAKES